METLVRTIYTTELLVISAVLPGRSVVRYTGADGSMRRVIDVTDSNLIVKITPKPAPTLVGKVIVKNPQDQPRHRVFVSLLDVSVGRAISVAVGPKGTFSFPKVPVSHYRLSLSGADGLFVERTSVHGAEVKDGVIEIVDGSQVAVSVTASAETGRLSGFVMKSDKAVPPELVVLAPESGSSDPQSYHGFQTDSDGSFDFTANYVLFAVDDQELEYANPEVVRPYLEVGKRVRIEPHGVQTERIGLASAVRH